MPDIYTIGDLIRLTAGIKNMDGEYEDPDSITLDIIGADGETLLEDGVPIKTGTGIYYYDWQIQGITDKYNLIAIWRWTVGGKTNIKRIKLRAIPETDW